MIALAADHRSVVEQLLATTKRGAALTRQLLAFSRKDQIAPTVADLNDDCPEHGNAAAASSF